MSDVLPVCPICGDLNPPGWRVCETCGSYLMQDDAQRDLLVRLEYARQSRYPQAGDPVDNSVDRNLLDGDRERGVQSATDEPRS